MTGLTFEQWIELLKVLGAMATAGVTTAITTVKGFRAVARKVDKEITALRGDLESYVTVEEYRTGKAALHAEVNELRVRLAVYEDRQARK